MVYIFSQTYSGKQTEEQNVISNNGNAENTPVAEDSSALKRAAKEAIASSGAEVNSDFSSFSFLYHFSYNLLKFTKTIIDDQKTQEKSTSIF